jgi:hypothetical protein
MFQRFSVCNGDADGLCSAVQWYHHEPGPVTLVTGLKRERALVDRVEAGAGDEVNIFDIAMACNRDGLLRLLKAGVRVRYVDHHAVGFDIPSGALFEPRIDTAEDACTSLLVDQRIGGACHGWALVGAYGDNLAERADRLAVEWGFDVGDRLCLRRMGEAINYNAYGETQGDVHVAPERLYEIMVRYRDPRDMLARERVIDELDARRRQDVFRALAVRPHWSGPNGSALVLPDAPWSRRALGAVANELANAEQLRAHAVMVRQGSGVLTVSVRAPLATPYGADALCQRFGGGGRARSAGVESLPDADLGRFIDALSACRWAAPSNEDAQSGPAAAR